MPDLFWTLLKIGGYTIIALFSLGVALIVATLALCVVWLVSDARRERDNAVMHEAIQAYLRQQLTAQE
jgi:hypothetical protein